MAKLGEIEKAIELTEEAYRLCRGVGDVHLTALWLSNLAGYALEGGNTAEARRRLDESVELARLIDDTRGIGGALDTSRLDRTARRRSRARVLVLRGGGGDRPEARGVVARCGCALGLRPSRSRRRRRRPRGAPRGGRARIRWIGRIRPGCHDPVHSLTSTTPALSLGEQAWEKARDEGAALDLDAALRLALDR